MKRNNCNYLNNCNFFNFISIVIPLISPLFPTQITIVICLQQLIIFTQLYFSTKNKKKNVADLCWTYVNDYFNFDSSGYNCTLFKTTKKLRKNLLENWLFNNFYNFFQDVKFYFLLQLCFFFLYIYRIVCFLVFHVSEVTK